VNINTRIIGIVNRGLRPHSSRNGTRTRRDAWNNYNYKLYQLRGGGNEDGMIRYLKALLILFISSSESSALVSRKMSHTSIKIDVWRLQFFSLIVDKLSRLHRCLSRRSTSRSSVNIKIWNNVCIKFSITQRSVGTGFRSDRVLFRRHIFKK